MTVYMAAVKTPNAVPYGAFLVIWRVGQMRFTERAIHKIQAPTASGKQEIFWSDDMPGFGVLCSGVSAAKTYIVQRALPSGIRRRVTVGPTNVLPLADAT